MSSMIIRKPVFLITLLLFGSQLFFILPAHAQEDCSTKIQEAQKYYDQGMIDDIPSMLAPCMASGFTRTQKIEAYKLIIMSYLFDENQFEAERTMLEFLKKYPEYEIMPNDPVEFVYLLESYRTASVFSFGVSGGFNLTDPRIIEPFTTLNTSEATFKNIIRPGFQAGIGIERYVSRKILLNLEVYMTLNQYEFIDIHDKGGNKSEITFNEKLYSIEVPLTISYEFTLKKTHFILRGGLSAAKITNVTGEPSFDYYEGAQILNGGNFDMGDYRKKMLYNGILGAGVRYKVPRGIVYIDLRAKMGLNNIVIGEKRRDNQVLLNNYHYEDDDFSLNTLSLSVGYYFSFYSPRKQR